MSFKNNISNYFQQSVGNGPTEEEILNGSAWNLFKKKEVANTRKSNDLQKAIEEKQSSDEGGGEGKWITVKGRHIKISGSGKVLMGGKGMNGGKDISHISSNGSASVKTKSKDQNNTSWSQEHKDKLAATNDASFDLGKKQVSNSVDLSDEEQQTLKEIWGGPNNYDGADNFASYVHGSGELGHVEKTALREWFNQNEKAGKEIAEEENNSKSTSQIKKPKEIEGILEAHSSKGVYEKITKLSDQEKKDIIDYLRNNDIEVFSDPEQNNQANWKTEDGKNLSRINTNGDRLTYLIHSGVFDDILNNEKTTSSSTKDGKSKEGGN